MPPLNSMLQVYIDTFYLAARVTGALRVRHCMSLDNMFYKTYTDERYNYDALRLRDDMIISYLKISNKIISYLKFF